MSLGVVESGEDEAGCMRGMRDKLSPRVVDANKYENEKVNKPMASRAISRRVGRLFQAEGWLVVFVWFELMMVVCGSRK